MSLFIQLFPLSWMLCCVFFVITFLNIFTMTWTVNDICGSFGSTQKILLLCLIFGCWCGQVHIANIGTHFVGSHASNQLEQNQFEQIRNRDCNLFSHHRLFFPDGFSLFHVTLQVKETMCLVIACFTLPLDFGKCYKWNWVWEEDPHPLIVQQAIRYCLSYP